MRGSIFYQTSVLIKIIFQEGSKKVERIDKINTNYKKIAGYETADSYRKIWNNFGNYMIEVYGIKNFELITEDHIFEYMNYKIFNNISHQYLQKISSALGKLENALNLFSKELKRDKKYCFDSRKNLVKFAKKHELTLDNYRNRAYQNPNKLIELLNNEKFETAASIQLHGGARSKGITLVKKSQLKGYQFDEITDCMLGVIMTKEKGGKTGIVKMAPFIYEKLESIIEKEGEFKINYNLYTAAIRNACRILNIKSEGTHGLRWNFAQRRIVECMNFNMSYAEALSYVSQEMKHVRPEISCTYISVF